jgi:hypothetical protein
MLCVEKAGDKGHHLKFQKASDMFDSVDNQTLIGCLQEIVAGLQILLMTLGGVLENTTACKSLRVHEFTGSIFYRCFFLASQVYQFYSKSQVSTQV